jgi:2,5-furandicarboxylate decarboxylase 1
VGPEKLELVANVNGSRNRLAAALDVKEENVIQEFQRRLDTPQPPIDISQGDAPVQRILLQGDEADLTNLPFYIQHEFDGSAYPSSGIDYCIDPETGTTNVGCWRLSLRNSKTAGTNVTAPSDLKRIYQRCVARG